MGNSDAVVAVSNTDPSCTLCFLGMTSLDRSLMLWPFRISSSPPLLGGCVAFADLSANPRPSTICMVWHGWFSEDVISVWNRSASNTEGIEKIRESVKRLLKIPSFVQVSRVESSRVHRNAVLRSVCVVDGRH